ncbi:MAG: beta galactosidase jelly roll domain-containing protein [Calditrichae bacterium]|nr:beta galactosidase jelly roll domain-containing protein [Calditrichota bacterium]MCB9058855.1 beta galactosidase jelly roll domain-containing protein [Calditrichia bacterium]
MNRFIYICIFFLVGSLWAADGERDWRRLVDLRGQWRFTIGDNMNWSDPEFDDSDWVTIFAPSNWEDEGFPGYDGYAWYRKKFRVNSVENLYVLLGTIDDVDQVFINGHLIGFSGQFPPDFFTGYNVDRSYPIPEVFLKKNAENTIAIRVYDAELEGGLVRGRLGIYEKQNVPHLIKSLAGYWKFKTGDNEERAAAEYDDSQWQSILAPMAWESQGYEYDGYAWYRLHFSLDYKYKDEKLVLLLGKIDDIDETYLNGKFIGRTGYISDNPRRIHVDDEWLAYRAYKMDNENIYFGRDNVIAIRVFDGLIQGGIYEGPLGIVTYDEYLKWSKRENIKKDIIYDLFHFFEWN